MKQFIFLPAFCFAIMFCFGQTQGELNGDALKNYQNADKALNDVYQNILKAYSKDTAFIKNLKNVQRIWIQYRDAEMLAKFPDRGPGFYGSIQPMCWNLYLTDLTKERTDKLKIWLEGIEEGDGCSGSVKTKN